MTIRQNPEVKRESFASRGIRANVTEHWQEVTCLVPDGCEVRDAFSIEERVADRAAQVLVFESGWGKEYTPRTMRIEGAMLRLENLKGRSSAQLHPQIFVYGESGAVYSYAVAWSGNWMFEIEPDASGFTIRGGLANGFGKRLALSEMWATPKVIAASSPSGSLNEIGNDFRVWCESWIPRNELSDRLPVEWNHWWAYEDKEINEEVFLRNVDIAAGIGIEVCTLDAGWFGSDDEREFWYDVRGDWSKVNGKRFPRGIRYLSDYVHSKGMKFGLWCEIEGLGAKAELCVTHPQFVAKRGGEFLGYVCLASKEAQAWAYGTLAGMIDNYACDWIKLDFNLDPGLGCDCPDHGHGPDDGLLDHYEGLYRVLSDLRRTFPEVLLENCSSGGLRTDLGIMQHMHLNFLSDPDYSEHQLQVIWAATLSLPPQKCLHWVWSNTCGTDETRPFPSFDLESPSLGKGELKFHMRVAMLHAMGFSHRLPLYSEETLATIREQIDFYKEHVREQIRDAAFFRLSPQAIRGGQGAGWNAFQYANPSGASCAFVFRLAHGEEEMRIRFEGLDEKRSYSVLDFDTCQSRELTGDALMREGLVFADLAPMHSRFITLRPL